MGTNISEEYEALSLGYTHSHCHENLKPHISALTSMPGREKQIDAINPVTMQI
jgi:hypothetical protein